MDDIDDDDDDDDDDWIGGDSEVFVLVPILHEVELGIPSDFYGILGGGG